MLFWYSNVLYHCYIINQAQSLTYLPNKIALFKKQLLQIFMKTNVWRLFKVHPHALDLLHVFVCDSFWHAIWYSISYLETLYRYREVRLCILLVLDLNCHTNVIKYSSITWTQVLGCSDSILWTSFSLKMGKAWVIIFLLQCICAMLECYNGVKTVLGVATNNDRKTLNWISNHPSMLII